MNNIDKMINVFKNKTVEEAIKGFYVEQNDEITNGVRNYLDKLPEEEVLNIQDFLKSLLNYCYDGKLDNKELDSSDYNKIKSLSDKELFLFKENIIYFYGRLLVKPDISILKKIYEIDDSKYIKLNVAFASLQSSKEDIEMDFVDKMLSDKEYDQLIRSWTMAYFKGSKNPYEYVDKDPDDWTPAKNPRIKRLSINEEDNSKFKKAIAFRLFDLAVIYLFVKNRKNNSLTNEDRKIIENSRIDYEVYSKAKQEKMSELKRLILETK